MNLELSGNSLTLALLCLNSWDISHWSSDFFLLYLSKPSLKRFDLSNASFFCTTKSSEILSDPELDFLPDPAGSEFLNLDDLLNGLNLLGTFTLGVKDDGKLLSLSVFGVLFTLLGFITGTTEFLFDPIVARAIIRPFPNLTFVIAFELSVLESFSFLNCLL
jgi:hypothetical protein